MQKYLVTYIFTCCDVAQNENQIANKLTDGLHTAFILDAAATVLQSNPLSRAGSPCLLYEANGHQKPRPPVPRGGDGGERQRPADTRCESASLQTEPSDRAAIAARQRSGLVIL